MRDVVDDIEKWLAAGKQVALATVIGTWGSSPRTVGAKMAFTADNEIAGSVSGGCVEGDVVAVGQEVLATGTPQLLQYGVADETAWDVGLACGGHIDVFVEPLAPNVFGFVRDLLAEDRAGVRVTVIAGPAEQLGRTLVFDLDGRRLGDLGPLAAAAQPAVARAAAAPLGPPRRVALGDEVALFVDPVAPAPLLVMVGGVHIAVALARLAHTLAYRTVVVDPRRAFGSATRFPHVDRLIQEWPDKALADVPLTPSTAVALLSHDPKIDDPALRRLLPSPVGYIGALGSRRTHARRAARLRQMGFDDAAIARIHAPVGLDIGAQTPAEIALAIMAEIVASRRQAAGPAAKT